jgi:tritrans,polycis-undecaprenyl-diphosphate synthase [geranylgeranyl-diphosphate specific]
MSVENYPKHIGIILDGNRRWARQRGKLPWDGHRAGFDKLKELFKWLKELDIKELSLYCFSMQNFKRDKKEVNFLMNIFEKAAKDILKNKDVHENKIKIRFIGRLHLLPENVQKAAKEAMEATKNYNNFIVNFCVAYGGREEVIDGVRKAAKDVKEGNISPEEIDEESFGKYLYMQSDLDIIIRTSGEKRLSNFLMWHSAYTELFFLDKHWPGFEKQDLIDVIEEFKEMRKRRFGK